MSSTVTKPRYRIGDLAKQHGKSTRAVRLYEELELLGEVERTDGGHRLYGAEALVRLGWIDKLQVLGMSLAQIRDFLTQLRSEKTGPAAMQNARRMFLDRLNQVRGQIESLEELASELENGLSYLETCNSSCAPNTERVSCSSCGLDHSVAPPILIQGLHPRSEESLES